MFMAKAENAYANPVRYIKNPLMSGYISEENSLLISESAAITVSRLNRGRIISFNENPNFRAFWYGTNKLFVNAIFFGSMINGTTAE